MRGRYIVIGMIILTFLYLMQRYAVVNSAYSEIDLYDPAYSDSRQSIAADSNRDVSMDDKLDEKYVKLSDLYNYNRNNLYDDPFQRRYLALNEYVPRSSLKDTEEDTRNFRNWFARPGQQGYRDYSTYPMPEYKLVGRGTVHSEDRFRPFYYNHNTQLQTYDDPWYTRPTPRRGKSYGPNTYWHDNSGGQEWASHPQNWVTSVNQYIPLKPLNTRWEKVGVLTTTSDTDDTILNLYRRPIAPMQNLFEWSVQNVDGMVIQITLNDPKDGDVLQSVPGMESKGSWNVKLYSKNQYVLV